jgi:hypothetical protein
MSASNKMQEKRGIEKNPVFLSFAMFFIQFYLNLSQKVTVNEICFFQKKSPFSYPVIRAVYISWRPVKSGWKNT